MMVMVPAAKRVLSLLAVATTVRLAGVVLAPEGVLEVMAPQVGLQVARLGTVVVVVGDDCVTSQVTPWLCKSLVRTTLNVWSSLVGTVAVTGVKVTPMPESSASLMLPVFLVSCCDWAVMIISNPGNLVWSGILPGAVYVAVPVVCSLERVPRVPSVGQFAGVGGVAVVPETVVVVN